MHHLKRPGFYFHVLRSVARKANASIFSYFSCRANRYPKCKNLRSIIFVLIFCLTLATAFAVTVSLNPNFTKFWKGMGAPTATANLTASMPTGFNCGCALDPSTTYNWAGNAIPQANHGVGPNSTVPLNISSVGHKTGTVRVQGAWSCTNSLDQGQTFTVTSVPIDETETFHIDVADAKITAVFSAETGTTGTLTVTVHSVPGNQRATYQITPSIVAPRLTGLSLPNPVVNTTSATWVIGVDSGGGIIQLFSVGFTIRATLPGGNFCDFTTPPQGLIQYNNPPPGGPGGNGGGNN